jgi:hypothetical protein
MRRAAETFRATADCSGVAGIGLAVDQVEIGVGQLVMGLDDLGLGGVARQVELGLGGNNPDLRFP